MLNYPKINTLTIAEFNATKNNIEATEFTKISDSDTTPLAIGSSLIQGGASDSLLQTFLTAANETATLENSINIGGLAANSTLNLLQFDVTGGVAGFSALEVPATGTGVLFVTGAAASFTNALTFASEDFTIDVTDGSFIVTAGTNIVTLSSTNLNIAGLASGTGTNLVSDGSGNILLDSSSKRYKHDIKDLEIDTSKIFDLVPKSFKFNTTSMQSFGLIAEEVNDILPELVVKNVENKVESVLYNRLPILMLAELKKLKDEIDELKKIINE